MATGAELMVTEDYSVGRAITYLQVCFIVGMMDSIPALGPAFFFFWFTNPPLGFLGFKKKKNKITKTIFFCFSPTANV